MNLNFNTFLQKLLPYLFTSLLAYVITTITFIFLPKSGVDFVQKENTSLSYQIYDGFYLSTKVLENKESERKIVKEELQTLTKYQLKAVYSTSSNGGWIIIEEKSSKKSTILKQLEKFHGYTLAKLYKTYVIFERDSNKYKLEIPKEKNVNYEVEKKNKVSVNENIVVNGNSVSVNRNYLNSYVSNLDKVWKDIAITDIRKKGLIEGFQVNRVNKNSVFGELGLKQNDVIKSVNGTKIKSYADAFKIYNEINKLDYLTLEILRNNEIVELNYEID